MTSLPSTHRRRRHLGLLLVLAGVVTAVAIGAPVLSGARSPDRPVAEREHLDTLRPPSVAPGPTRPARRVAVRAAATLRGWDRARALAWARADARMLRGLYRRGSAAGRADVARLRAWSARGLRVRGLTTQLLSVEVLREHPAAGGWTIRVRDRVTGGRVVGEEGSWRLPPGVPTTRVITLRKDAEVWRVSRVV